MNEDAIVTWVFDWHREHLSGRSSRSAKAMAGGRRQVCNGQPARLRRDYTIDGIGQDVL